MTLTSTLIAVSPSGDYIPDPSVTDLSNSQSLHALAFTSSGHLLLNESEGSFDLDIWENVYDRAEKICRGDRETDVDMETGITIRPLEQTVRVSVEEKLRRDFSWKITGS